MVRRTRKKWPHEPLLKPRIDVDELLADAEHRRVVGVLGVDRVHVMPSREISRVRAASVAAPAARTAL